MRNALGNRDLEIRCHYSQIVGFGTKLDAFRDFHVEKISSHDKLILKIKCLDFTILRLELLF
jgi:hypothetical protein